MIINIASFGGRTHLLDTARELAKLGHTVRFYSYVPTKRAIKFGLPKECNYSIFWFAFPYLIWLKIFGFGGFGTYIYFKLCDWFIAYYMKPCDVFIGQSPMHNYSIQYAKRKYKALTILERGSVHVLTYNQQVKDNPLYKGKSFQPYYIMKSDMDGYIHPDYISVGSKQVADSFIDNGISKEKVFINNYGFDTSQFNPTILSDNPYDIIFVGRWSYNKGCDLLASACRKKGYQLLHVGNITDLSFPHEANMTHIDAVSQEKLQYYYSLAKIFVLPSRSEGLAMVLMQAAACGLPIVCSNYTGGADMIKYIAPDDNYILIMEDFSVNSLIENIDKALTIAEKQIGYRCYLNSNFSDASWDGYGKRYNDFLHRAKSRI